MPRKNKPAESRKAQTLEQLAAEELVYPLEAFEFVQQGLHFTAARVHRAAKNKVRHVTGQQLAEGLREYAFMQWGLMARCVLEKWNITTTYDFGRIVYAMVENDLLNKTDEDSVEDFRNVYDFATLDAAYRIESKV